MQAQNRDGAGIAWVDKKGVEWCKGLIPEDVRDLLQAAPGAWMIHFRTATAGGICGELEQPFPLDQGQSHEEVGCSEHGVFAHNGTWSDWRDITLMAAVRNDAELPEGPMSDSRALAFLVSIYGTGVLEIVKGRFAVLTPEGSQIFPSQGHGWSNVNGYLVSNTLWRPDDRRKGARVVQSYGQSDFETKYRNWDAPSSLPDTKPQPNKPRALSQKR